jgi:hypothetical protein
MAMLAPSQQEAPEVAVPSKGEITPPCGVHGVVRRASVVYTGRPSMTSTTGAVSQPLMM